MNGTQKKAGDVLIVWTAREPEKKSFLLTGDSFAERRYQNTLQAFSWFQKDGFAFKLDLFVPRTLRDRLVSTCEKQELWDRVTVLEASPKHPEHYEEIIEVTDIFDQSLILRKFGIMINGTANTLIENLKGSFEENDR